MDSRNHGLRLGAELMAPVQADPVACVHFEQLSANAEAEPFVHFDAFDRVPREVAATGEAVQWSASTDSERLRLRAAYVALVFQNCKSAARNLELGQMSHLVIEYDGASFIIEEIEGDYLIAVELNYSANISDALENIKPVLAKIANAISRDEY